MNNTHYLTKHENNKKQRQADNEDLKILENCQKEIKQLKDKR